MGQACLNVKDNNKLEFKGKRTSHVRTHDCVSFTILARMIKHFQT